MKGKPERIRTENGPEFISNKLKEWCHGNEIEIIYIQLGKPMQNGYIERFNSSYRRGVLDAYIFKTLDQVRVVSQNWQNDYNNTRPHLSLGDMSPRDYK